SEPAEAQQGRGGRESGKRGEAQAHRAGPRESDEPARGRLPRLLALLGNDEPAGQVHRDPRTGEQRAEHEGSPDPGGMDSRPPNQPVAAPNRPPRLSSVALRNGLRCALDATPRTEWRTVAFVAFFPIERPNVFIDASVFGDRLCVYPAGADGHAPGRL